MIRKLTREEFLKLALFGTGVVGMTGASHLMGKRVAVAHTGDPNHGGYPDAYVHESMRQLDGFIAWLAGARGYVGEVGIPSNLGAQRQPFSPDQEKFAVLGEYWYDRADEAKLWTSAQEASERYYKLATGGYFASLYLSPAVASDQRNHQVLSRPGYQAALIERHNTLGPTAAGRGINFSGGQKFDEAALSNTNPGVYGTDYWYPTDGPSPLDPTTGKNSFEYLASRGTGQVRLGFRWERMQPTLNAPLNAEELARYRRAVNNAGKAGLRVIIDVHNYGGYVTSAGRQPLNSGTLPASAFYDLWTRLSDAFKGNQYVAAYDLMNEPDGRGGIMAGSYASPLKAWEAISQKAYDTIRAKGDTKRIMIPTYVALERVAKHHTTGPWLKKNGVLVKDGQDIMYTAHHYFDHWTGAGTGGGSYLKSYADEVAISEQRGF